MTPEDVPAGPVLVDTDVATWLLLDGGEAAPWKVLLRGHVLALAFASVGELLALPISRKWGRARTVAWRDIIRQRFVIIPFQIATTEQWAALHVKYHGHLQNGGANDLWIAASALSSDPQLPLATNNLSDFSKIAHDHPLLLVHPQL